MFHRIPPVGNPISWSHPAPPPTLVADNEQCFFVQSGTAALAQALIIAKSAFTTDTPEVIVPGYACPDIISAAVYAGITPILVDLEPDRPYMSLSAIENAITDHTVAIIAINFMGIPERIAAIRASLGDSGIIVIEDSAQWYPDADGETPVSSAYQGDLVVLSFGKGKPVSLLGGGALIIRKDHLMPLVASKKTTESNLLQHYKLKTVFHIYNAVISPTVYWALEYLPFINIGTTNYKTLNGIQALDETRKGQLKVNIDHYQAREINAQHKLQHIIQYGGEKVIDLTSISETYSNQRLLRYPLLTATSESRNKLISQFKQAGVGASPLYASSLPKIEGTTPHIRTHSSLAYAEDFAKRLITLPTHTHTDKQHIASIEKLLNAL